MTLELVVSFSPVALAATQKDATLRLNVMNLDCTVDQVFAGNDPSYIVNPAGCTAPPVTDVINEVIKETMTEVLTHASPESVSTEAETLPGEEISSVPVLPSTPTAPTYPADAAPIIPTSTPSQTVPPVITGVAIGATIVISTIVVDVLVFNAQLVSGAVSVGRRIIQFIAGLVIK